MNVLVLGMHRSGTSAVTRLVTLAGVPTADDPDVGRAGPANERGFWEVRPLTALNEEILWTLGGTWSAPPPLHDGWVDDERVDELRAGAGALLDAVMPSPPFVWKDPRLCLTLPFWFDLVGPRPAIVLVVRNPLEIARSLERRDGLSRELALALWERYLRDAVQNARGLPVAVVSYERVLDAPAAWTSSIRTWLTDLGVDCALQASSESIEEFIDPGLQHARLDAEVITTDPEVSDAQRDLFHLLMQAEGTHQRFEPDPLPASTPGAAAALEARRADRMRTRSPARRSLSRIRRAALRRAVSLRRRF